MKAAIEQALADGQVRQLKAELESESFIFVPWATSALRFGQELRVLLPFSPEAVIVYSPPNSAFALISQGEQTTVRQQRGRAQRQLRPLLREPLRRQALDQLQQSLAFRSLQQALHAAGYQLDNRFRAAVDEGKSKLLVALKIANWRFVHYPYTLTARVQRDRGNLRIDTASVKIFAKCELS